MAADVTKMKQYSIFGDYRLPFPKIPKSKQLQNSNITLASQAIKENKREIRAYWDCYKSIKHKNISRGG